ncbi:retrotransposon protein, putative, ty3-gypsy subclass [Tanacetum coccineum]
MASLSSSLQSLGNPDSFIGGSPFGLFPGPWCPSVSGVDFSEVIKKFILLGQIMTKTLYDGRVLDLPLTKAFYKFTTAFYLIYVMYLGIIKSFIVLDHEWLIRSESLPQPINNATQSLGRVDNKEIHYEAGSVSSISSQLSTDMTDENAKIVENITSKVLKNISNAVTDDNRLHCPNVADLVDGNGNYKAEISVGTLEVLNGLSITDSKPYIESHFYDPTSWTYMKIEAATGSSECTTMEHFLNLRSTYTEVEDYSGTRDSFNDIDEDGEIALVSTVGDIVSATSAATTVSAATTTTTIINIVDDITLAQALEEMKSTKPKKKGIIIHELGESTTTISSQLSSQQSQDKGKGILLESVKPIKKKDQISLDEETSLNLQAEFNEEERLAREKAKKEEEANIALIETWDDIQAKIDVDHQLAERMQVQEQEELSIEEKATLFQQLLEK